MVYVRPSQQCIVRKGRQHKNYTKRNRDKGAIRYPLNDSNHGGKFFLKLEKWRFKIATEGQQAWLIRVPRTRIRYKQHQEKIHQTFSGQRQLMHSLLLVEIKVTGENNEGLNYLLYAFSTYEGVVDGPFVKSQDLGH